MTKQQYISKTGAKRFRPFLSQRAAEQLSAQGNIGFCIACGDDVTGVEPDAEKYTCEACGQPKVFGLEQLFVLGIARISG